MQKLHRNQKANLSEMIPNLTQLTVGLGWKTRKNDTVPFDLDASGFMLKTDNEIRDRKDFVFYNNLQDSLGVMKHSGDNIQGGDGDSEQISIDFTKIPEEIGHLTFVVTIHDGVERQQTFGQVQDAYIRIFDSLTKTEFVRYDLAAEFFTAVSVVIADIVKHENQWHFDAVGLPFSGGLKAIAQDFDLNLDK